MHYDRIVADFATKNGWMCRQARFYYNGHNIHDTSMKHTLRGFIELKFHYFSQSGSGQRNDSTVLQ